MKYTGQFRDINENLYTVNITTNGDSSSTTNVVLGATPFTTEIETSGSHIYKPCKYSSATIRLISDDYNFDLYSATAQQNKVELIDSSGKVRWTGYTTPNLYSQGYENEFEEVEIEAIDALSTLQYYKYTTLGQTKEIVSLIDIIDSLISKCNAYTHYYFSSNVSFSSTSQGCLVGNLFISEQNFFDEDDEPMTMQEVLEEICKYIGFTCIADGDQVYFLDYDAIKNGINTYYKYAVGSTTATLVTLSQVKEVVASDYSENGGQISLDNVFNKATVKAELYSFDSIIPSIWDDKYLSLYMRQGFDGNWHYFEEINEDGKGGKHKCFFKYYSHKNYKSYYYDKDTLEPIQNPYNINYGFTQLYVGATICRHFSEKVTSYDTVYNDIDFTDYLLIHCHNTYDGTLRPMFSLEVNDSTASFIGGNSYIIIQGNFRFLDRESEMYIMQGYSNKDDDFNPDKLYIDCKLQYGNKFWNGTAWTTTDSTFKLFFDNNGQTDHCINQIFPVKNNITWDMGLDEEGYAIPMPTTYVTTGKPLFTLYQPHKLDNGYRCDAVWLSNFDIIAKVQNFQIDGEKDSDTEYSNVINEDFVNEFEDVELKICTWDNKEANYSAVCYWDGSNYQFLDAVYNKATKQSIRLEEHLIYKLVTQYSTPSAILELNLKNDIQLYAAITDNFLDGKVFIVDSMTIDWEMNKNTVRLIEKK